MLYCDRFIKLFHINNTQKTNTEKENIFNLIVQNLEKYSRRVQQLAYRGWRQVNRQEELLTGGKRRAERLSARGYGGKLQFHSHQTFMKHILASLKVDNLKVRM